MNNILIGILVSISLSLSGWSLLTIDGLQQEDVKKSEQIITLQNDDKDSKTRQHDNHLKMLQEYHSLKERVIILETIENIQQKNEIEESK